MNDNTELNDIVMEEWGKPLVPYGDYMVPLTDAVTLIMMESGDECPDCFDRAEQIIALVRADERKQMAGALEAKYEAVRTGNTDIMGGYDSKTAGVLEGLAFAIGLTEENPS